MYLIVSVWEEELKSVEMEKITRNNIIALHSNPDFFEMMMMKTMMVIVFHDKGHNLPPNQNARQLTKYHDQVN